MSDETPKNFSLFSFPESPASLDNAIKNLTDKPTRSIGETFSDIWYLVFGDITLNANKKRIKHTHDMQTFKESLEHSINSIPESKRTEPSLQVTAQALENSKYCISSKELRNLFVNLISGSMNSDYEPYVHPSFGEIIKQMSPIDAQLLREYPAIESAAVPTVDYVIENNLTHAYKTNLYNIIFPRLTNCDIHQVSKSVSALRRLGLIDFDESCQHTDKTLYDFFLQTDYYKKQSLLTRGLNPDCHLKLRKYVSYLTPLGIDFAHVCIHP